MASRHFRGSVRLAIDEETGPLRDWVKGKREKGKGTRKGRKAKAEGTPELLRIPAAVVVIGMATLLIIGEFFLPDLTNRASVRDFLPAAVLGIPFVLP